MTWTQIPRRTLQLPKGPCFRMGFGRSSNAKRHSIRCTMHEAPEWLQPGHKIEVLHGDGEHTGRIMIKPGNDYLISRSNRANACVQFFFPPWPGFDRKENLIRLTDCKFIYEGEAVVVRIPEWPVAPITALRESKTLREKAGNAPIPLDTIDAAKAWATRVGFTMFRDWEDMRALNLHAERVDHCGFVRKFPTKGVRAA